MLSHGHWLLRGVEWREVKFVCFERLCEGEQAAIFNDELRNWVVLASKFLERYGFFILEPLKHGMVSHQLAKVDVVAFVDGGE